MYYSSGDLKIEKNKLHKLINSLSLNVVYTTFDIIEMYQGSRAINENTPPGISWNANFGKILKKCSENTKLIDEIESNKPIKINGKNTTTSTWKRI